MKDNRVQGTHGGLDYSRLKSLGLTPDDILDFSVSINPFPVHPNVLKAVKGCTLIHYPDSSAKELREKIAEQEGCTADEILAVNGTSQGIHLLGQAFLNRETSVLIAAPAYSQYKKVSNLQQAAIKEIISVPEKNFVPPVDAIIEEISSNKPKIFWICNPNNPTGTYVSKEDMERIVEEAQQSNTIVVIDEAYVAFTHEELRYRKISSNVLRLNSMTKDYGIPGLRIGYIHGDKKLIDEIIPYQPEWSLSAPAQKAGIACLKEGEYYRKTWKEVREETERFRAKLETLGMKTYSTESNFFMAQLGAGPDKEGVRQNYAAQLQKHLETKNMQIRDCTSFGLPDHIRIGIHSKDNNEKLFAAIEEVSHLWQ